MGDAILKHYGYLLSFATQLFPLALLRTMVPLCHRFFLPFDLILAGCQWHALAISATHFVPLRQLINYCNSVALA